MAQALPLPCERNRPRLPRNRAPAVVAQHTAQHAAQPCDRAFLVPQLPRMGDHTKIERG